MNNEETILDPQYHTIENEPKAETKKSGWAEKAAYAAGGAVFGAGATLAGQAAASPTANVEEEVQAETAEQPKPEDSPAPEDTIVATATGVRVAQVDDDASFAQAFADARAQVGPGGVFEWHGRVYNTYYKDEWESMSAAERQEYQAMIDYNEITGDEPAAHHHNDMAQHHHHAEPETAVAQEASVEDDEVHVLAVGETDLNGDGVAEYAAVLEVGGNEIMVVDIDRDGVADVAICDANGNGQLDDNEIADLSGENIAMPTQSDGDMYMAQAETEPDYMNDANVGLYEA